MCHRFHIGRMCMTTLACPLPVAHRLLVAARRRVVLGDQLRLGPDSLRELGLQHLGDALMVLLAGAPQQRLIGRILNERMLKGIRRLWWYTALVRNLCLDQPDQLSL